VSSALFPFFSATGLASFIDRATRSGIRNHFQRKKFHGKRRRNATCLKSVILPEENRVKPRRHRGERFTDPKQLAGFSWISYDMSLAFSGAVFICPIGLRMDKRAANEPRPLYLTLSLRYVSRALLK